MGSSLNDAAVYGAGFSGGFCSTEQGFDIQVGTPSFGRSHP